MAGPKVQVGDWAPDPRDRAIEYVWALLVMVDGSLPDGPVPREVVVGLIRMLEGALKIADGGGV